MADPEPLTGHSTEGEYIAFRWTDYDVPFWARENSRDGRWNLAGEGVTQYWSLTPEAAWAELVRAENLQTEADLDEIRMPFWTARIPTSGLLDLRLDEQRAENGITETQLTANDRQLCQRLATQLREVGCRGLISPSAALPQHASLTLFGPRRAIAWTRHPALASTIPAAETAVGRPPPGYGLLDRVRRR